jgi:DNA invertase Pin-like site-specific DNA recombinase
MGILALIAEFENDIRRERQLDGIAKAKQRGVRLGVEPKLTEAVRLRSVSFAPTA